MRYRIRSNIKMRGSDRVFDITNYVVLSFVTIIILYPLIYVVSCSLSSTYAVVTNKVVLWPVGLNVESYKAILRHDMILSGYLNSVFYMVFGTAFNMLLVVLCAYPLSRSDLPGLKGLTFIFFFTMLFNGGMIPNYILVNKLGMINTRWALIIPYAFQAYNMIITRTYFKTNISKELLEASYIDGCSDMKFFTRIALPLSKPIIAVMILFHAIMHWNGFFKALLFLNNSKFFPLQLVLRDILFVSEVSDELLTNVNDDSVEELSNFKELIKFSVIVVGALPVLMIYPFVQKHFVRGVMIGSIKG